MHARCFSAFSICRVIQDCHRGSITSYGASANVTMRGKGNASDYNQKRMQKNKALQTGNILAENKFLISKRAANLG